METIKVNMTPCEDIKTIHASQNDNEAREWGFELHNNGEKIDSSSISDQLVFKAYEGGTEQILPENGSTPTTSPFKGDIKYPQGLLSDQEFLYRESPTEEDGLAKITDIKGNTLVWNQLVQNGNFADKSNWIEANATFTVNNNIATMVASVTYGNIEQILSVKANHMYFATCDIKLTTVTNFNLIQFRPYVGVSIPCVSTTKWQTLSGLFIPTTDATVYYPRITDARASGWDAIQIRNCMVIDLTQMGLGISSPSEFTSLFPLPYYAYNQGTLLSFNGNGIKTVGKNLVFKTIPNSSINGSGVIISTSNFQMSVAQVLKGKEYVITTNDNSKKVLGFFYDEPVVGSASYNGERIDDSSSYTFISPITGYVAFRSLGGYSTPMLEFGSVASDYEPYTSSTLSLPISTYFPNGMKSAGSVYDELTETKAITRIGELNFDSSTTISTWESSDGWTANIILNTYKPNGAIKSDKFEFIGLFVGASAFATSAKAKGGYCLGALRNENRIYFYSSSATTSNELINAIRGTNLYYELVSPTETSFTTASLVTENGEIPLSNDDGVLIGKCTEQLSSESGFFDAKIKLADADGECYSNKIQLHVERKPS